MRNKNGEIKDIVIICEGNTKSPDKKLILFLLKENGIEVDNNEIIPIGGKCDFIDKVRQNEFNRKEFLKIVLECSKNKNRTYTINKDIDNIYLFFDYDSNGHEINFEKKEIESLDMEIYFARPYLEVDLGFKSKEDYDLKIAKQRIKKRRYLKEWLKCIDKINS